MTVPSASERRAEHRQATERRRRTRQAALLVLGVVWLASGVWAVVGAGGLLDVWRLDAERARIARDVETLEDENRQVTAALQAVESDPFETERLARETLDYQRPGEIVFLLEEP